MTETMITGNDYSIISNKGFDEFFSSFVDDLKINDRQLIVEEIAAIEEEVYEYFLAKDRQTYDDYEQHGYVTNEHGEGCFSIIARRVNNLEYKMEIVNKAEEEVEEAVDPYPAVLILHDTWNYTLVLPAAIEDSTYCQLIYEKAIRALK
ncbi:hypothetical protein [Chitinophaga pinensis]|uniref:Uncharacterized protein n=1 Tax=Chitinophaga pinensis (strain ATCC 43595 / DSM 2588 / LMG 13176 / NBRC 15968 / NCIMB 11800 / UQM 2034) TaxID=485918 RepID=A0A979H003_CHIPD|nr:hypothetical protein [Chitinophaga pinensis]ACU64356.1 hypothetical protein Cpin_6955 [Chitinophaga pinensis DSM 2588]